MPNTLIEFPKMDHEDDQEKLVEKIKKLLYDNGYRFLSEISGGLHEDHVLRMVRNKDLL